MKSMSCRGRTPSHPADGSLQTTLRRINLRRLGVHAPILLGIPVRQIVHGRLGQVEPIIGMVDREHRDRLAVVRQLPATPAAGRVPGADGGRAPDVGVVGERAKGGETLGLQAVGPVRAGGRSEGLSAIVVCGVPGDGDRAYGGDKGGGESDDGASELHDDSCEKGFVSGLRRCCVELDVV